MVKFREQRGGLEESMATVVELENRAQLVDYVAAIFKGQWIDPEKLDVIPQGIDDRIGWDTFIITLDGQAIGFTNGPL